MRDWSLNGGTAHINESGSGVPLHLARSLRFSKASLRPILMFLLVLGTSKAFLTFGAEAVGGSGGGTGESRKGLSIFPVR